MIALQARLSDEHEAALERLACDLRLAGVKRSTAMVTCDTYARALDMPSEALWAAFYRALYHGLGEAASDGSPHALGRVSAAALLAIIDDDFGQTLFDARERARIRATLAE